MATDTVALKAEWEGITVTEWWHHPHGIAAITPHRDGYMVETLDTDGLIMVSSALTPPYMRTLEAARETLRRHGYSPEVTR